MHWQVKGVDHVELKITGEQNIIFLRRR